MLQAKRILQHVTTFVKPYSAAVLNTPLCPLVHFQCFSPFCVNNVAVLYLCSLSVMVMIIILRISRQKNSSVRIKGVYAYSLHYRHCLCPRLQYPPHIARTEWPLAAWWQAIQYFSLLFVVHCLMYSLKPYLLLLFKPCSYNNINFLLAILWCFSP